MAVRAEKRQVLRPIVSPVAVDVLDFDWYSSGNGMALRPTALRARLRTQIAYDELTKE